MSERALCSPPGSGHSVYRPQIPQNDNTLSGAEQDVPQCWECSQRRRRRAVSLSKGASLYREHAAHYSHKFRALIDYTIQEKPRQIVSGGILLLFLYFISFHSVVPSPETKDTSPLQKGGSQADVHVCDAQTTRPSVKSDAEDRVELPCGDCIKEALELERGRGEVRNGEAPLSFEEHTSYRRGKEAREEAGKHVTAPGLSWEGIFPTATEPIPPESHSVRRGVIAVLAVIAVYTFLQSKDGLLVRPHPGFWRVVHGIGVAHLLLLVWLLAVSPEVGRETLQHLFPEIRGKRKDVFAGTIVADCRINADTFYRQVTSVWFVSHVGGWLAKMIILRDWGFCLLYSISFEVAELSFHWLVPELRECWWDSIVVDALLSNLSGILLGVVLMKLVKMHQYDWMGSHPLYRKLVTRFMPFGGGYEWAFYETPRHLGLSIILLLICVFTELNVFFLMASLGIPAAHYCNPLRVLYLTLLGASAAAEHYEYTMHSQERIGHNEWLLCIILIVELMVSAKYGSENFKKAVIPPEICSCWGLSLALFGIWCSCYFTVKRDSAAAHQTTKRRVQQKSLELVDECTSVKARGQIVKQGAKDISRDVVPPSGNLTDGHMEIVSKIHPCCSWWGVTGQRLRWYRDRLRLLVLTIPPQACFLPLIYLSKFYFYDYEELE